MKQCAAQQHAAADKELNALYQQITARLKGNPKRKKLLVGAQRAWVGFRDAECTFSASGVEGGPLRWQASSYRGFVVFTQPVGAGSSDRRIAAKASGQAQQLTGQKSAPW
jgi:hypothetical protein